MLHSNASKYGKIWRTRLRRFLRMVGEYGPGSFRNKKSKYSRSLILQKLFHFLLSSIIKNISFDLLGIDLDHQMRHAPPGCLSGQLVRPMTWWLWVRYPVEASFLCGFFRFPPLPKHVSKVVAGLGKKVVLVLVWESQGTHVHHRPPWYDLSCLSGVKRHYNQPTIQMINI